MLHLVEEVCVPRRHIAVIPHICHLTPSFIFDILYSWSLLHPSHLLSAEGESYSLDPEPVRLQTFLLQTVTHVLSLSLSRSISLPLSLSLCLSLYLKRLTW